MEVIKILLNHDGVISGKLLLYDGNLCSFRSIKLRQKKDDCEVCGSNPSITRLIDYEQFCRMAATDKNPGLNLLEASERISVNDYKNLDCNHLLIDVRSSNEFEICSLDQSVNVPIKLLLADKIDAALKEEMTKKPVFVVCRRGNDSQLAVRHLAERLNIKSRDLIGGLHAWTRCIDKDFPIY